MINRIEGILESLEETAALVVVGEIAYEIAVPAADIPELYSRIGSRMTFHTLHYLESQGQGSSFWPKLIGFQSSKDRAFFELITTVKGIGVRRALRALTIPFARVAEAIVMKDLALLMSLPEIGRKTAETMVLELRDKMDSYAKAASTSATSKSATRKGEPKSVVASPANATGALNASAMMDAMNVLVQLGESRIDARALIDLALEREPDLTTANTLVSAALASKGMTR
ncbi:MAG: helix-hairpin-helix domain-containing protein [Planctomycetota bacterium]|jgi:Holliday junction DNA helicase RuvA|nr:helix-hairpin-helix domain-containing protein [Planctomycetota bacterium]